jgi:glycosyltransferase involved in cell wall biosynthesis
MGEDVTMESIDRLRVLQLIARMNVGGPAVLVADLMRNLDSSRFETRLVTGYCDENESDYLDEVATDIKAIKIPGFGRSISIGNDLKSFFLLIKEIRRFKPDVVHTHTAKAGVLGRVAAFLARPSAKRIHTFHGHLLHGYFDSRKVQILVLLEKMLGSITYRFVAIGNVVKADLVKAGIGKDSKFEVIFPGLQNLYIHPKLEARKTLGLDSVKTYVVYVGRLTQIKRPDRLIDLGRLLKASYPTAHLIIVGAGEFLEALTLESENESLPITFLGWRNDIDMFLSASDIAVLCSDNEGIPLTLIQASQAALPIVTTNVGSVSDIVLDGVTGLLTEVSANGVIQGVSKLVDDPDLRVRLGESGQMRARELFSSQAMVERHEELYSQSL